MQMITNVLKLNKYNETIMNSVPGCFVYFLLSLTGVINPLQINRTVAAMCVTKETCRSVLQALYVIFALLHPSL